MVERYTTGRLYSPYRAFLGELPKTQWNYDDFVSHGLGNHFLSGDAVDMDYVDGQHIVAFPPEALTELYYQLLFLLPEDRDEIIANMHDIPENVAVKLHESIYASVSSIRDLANRNGDSLEKVFAVQHYGPNEVNPYSFGTTLPQLHFHIYSYDKNSIDSHPNLFIKDGVNNWQRTDKYRHVLREPFYRMIHELLSSRFNNVEFNRNRSSFYIGKETDVDAEFSIEEIDLLKSVTEQWSVISSEIQEAFCNGELDENGRPLLKRKAERMDAVKNFIEGKGDVFSQKTIRQLNWLAENIKESKAEDIWNWMYIGPSGALAWEFDFKKGIRRLVVSPRSFVLPNKNWAILGESDSHFVIKDRSLTMSESVLENAINRQRDLNRMCKEMFC